MTTCARCLMDDTAADITFDLSGTCSYCSEFEKQSDSEFPNGHELEKKLGELLSRIKKRTGKFGYNCIVGVSGGVDSSFLLTQVVDLGLTPLVVHMDNGWNSEIAQNNISQIITKLNVDYISHVIYWPEYRSLMESFFAADVVDIELLYDNAMLAVNYRLAKQYGIKFIIGGTNTATEGFRMPNNWSWLKYDKRNIKSIHRRNPNRLSARTFPSIGIIEYVWYKFFRRIKWVSLLDYMHYDKRDATSHLVEDFSFKPYPYKHYESVFTRFYQGFLLPTKFGIDKRKVHLSNLIMSGQLTRSEGLALLETDAYPSEKELRNDIRFFLKKLKWSEKQLNEYLERAPRAHSDFANNAKYWRIAAKIKRRVLGRD